MTVMNTPTMEHICMKLEILKTINCLTHFRGKEKEEHMNYTKKEKEEINTWLVHVGALSDVDD